MQLTNDGQLDISYYQKNPVAWSSEFLECRLWHRQEEILNAIAQHDLVSVASGHGIGKSFTAADAVLWFTFNFSTESNIVITTAPTLNLVRSVLWAEIGQLHKVLQRRFNFAGEMLQLELRFDRKHFCRGMTADDPNAFQGLHADSFFLVFDEACGISREIYESGESMISAAGNKALLIGNPTHPNTYFHHTTTGKIPNFHFIRVSSTECPNVKERDDGSGLYDDVVPAPFPGLVSSRWINQKIQTYGRHSNYCKSRVFGLFPDHSEDQLIPGRDLALAILKGAQLRALLKHLEEANHIMRSDEIHKIIGR